MRATAFWFTLAATLLIPVGLAATSPLLAWRGPIYVAAGFAGVIAMAVLVVQPLLATRKLPGLSPRWARKLHRLTGGAVLALVLGHVAGLWLTSPPDVIAALTFNAPTAFFHWGVLALWALLATALLATARRRLPHTIWRAAHLTCAAVIVAATALHVLPIDGTMTALSKAALTAALILTTIAALRARR